MLNKSLNISKKIIKRSKIQLDEIKDFNLNFNSKFFRFSIIMVIDNIENLENSLKSIIHQKIGFENNIEVILIDISQDNSTEDICLKYQKQFPQNILYHKKINADKTTAKNWGLEVSNAKYLNFLNVGDELDLDCLEKVNSFFQKYYYDVDVVSIPISCLNNEFDENLVNEKYDTIRIIDLNKEANYIQYSFSQVFFKNEVIKNFNFEREMGNFDKSLLFNKIVVEKSKIGLVSDTQCLCKSLDKINPPIEQINNENYYLQFRKFFNNIFKYSSSKFGEVVNFIKYDATFVIQKIFDIVDTPKKIDKNTLNTAKSVLSQILDEIDDEVIIKQRNVDKSLKYTMLLFKHKLDGITIKEDENNVVKMVNGTVIDELNYHRIYIDYVEIYKNNLYLGGYLKSFFTKEELKIQIKKTDDDKIDIFDSQYIEYPSRDKYYLDLLYDPSLNFEFKIPLNSSKYSKLNLIIAHKNTALELDLFFNGYVKLSQESFYSKKENYLIKFENNAFYIEKYKLDNLLALEQRNIKYLESLKDSTLKEVIDFRKEYYQSYREYENRKIWLFMDRVDQAGDNGEHLYKYCLKQNDNIEKYFVISKDSKDYARLKKVGNVIDYGSKEHMLLCCFADKIIVSHPDDEFVNPFYHKREKYYNGLFSAKICFLQHGIIINNISTWLHKYDKFLYLIVTSTRKEYESLFEYPYNYGKKVVQLLGLPRFDGLENKEKNQIVFMPTWRRYLEKMDENQLKNSMYFKTINSMLNNVQLLEFLKNNNYSILFKPHPNLNEFIDLFDLNNQIKVASEDSYQKIINESKLLITDFSSVTFDFAYLKKPIIYYQFDSENFHFDLKESYFDFDKMGFGEVIFDENMLIQLIIEYISNNCKLKNEYEDRINDFFEFRDKNNCKRVYEKLITIN